jgi:hypothetical protein
MVLSERGNDKFAALLKGVDIESGIQASSITYIEKKGGYVVLNPSL